MSIPDEINLAIAIATVLSVVVSAVMAAMTYAMLKASRGTVDIMKAQIEAASRPYIQISPYVRPMTTAVELHIKNTGSTSAEKVRLSLDRDYFFNAEEGPRNNIRSYTAFSKEIQMLPPGAELRFLLGIGHRILTHPKLCPTQFAVAAKYEYQGKTVSESTTIDLEPFGKSTQPIDPMVERFDKLIAELKEFREQVKTP
jgi:archaellum component FlaG (FlaF/FlaG flagellin family)